jgi:IS5 family transposase
MPSGRRRCAVAKGATLGWRRYVGDAGDAGDCDSDWIARAKVEHVFGVIKRVFGFQKVCYRGLAKNLHRLEAIAALANLFLVRRRLLK